MRQSSPEILAVIVEEAIAEYSALRRLASPDYSMPTSVRKNPVWRKLARILDNDNIAARDWLRALFDGVNGGSPFVTALASDSARRNYDNWASARGTPEDEEYAGIDGEVVRAGQLLRNVGPEILDGFFLDNLSGFSSVIRCALCRDEALQEVAARFGKTCRDELERNPRLMNRLALHTNACRLQDLRSRGIVPAP